MNRPLCWKGDSPVRALQNPAASTVTGNAAQETLSASGIPDTDRRIRWPATPLPSPLCERIPQVPARPQPLPATLQRPTRYRPSPRVAPNTAYAAPTHKDRSESADDL